jgi:large subunit ribosomal protein L9
VLRKVLAYIEGKILIGEVMKVILEQDFESLGFEGDTVEVARGYARNYLVPKGIAVEATKANLKAFGMRKDKILARRMRDKAEAERVKEKISELSVTIKQKAGAEGKLYGSVTTRDVAQELENKGVVVDRRKISLDEPIKSLGEFDVPIKLYPEVQANIRVIVEPEEEQS